MCVCVCVCACVCVCVCVPDLPPTRATPMNFLTPHHTHAAVAGARAVASGVAVRLVGRETAGYRPVVGQWGRPTLECPVRTTCINT